MKELIDFIWNMPLGVLIVVFAVFAAVVFIPFLWFFVKFVESWNESAKLHKKRRSEYSRMNKDFNRMKKRVEKELES